MPERHDIVCLPLANPEPLATLVSRTRNGAGWTTSVARRWPDGVTYCGRCPRDQCNLHQGMCLVQVQALVPRGAAAHLSTHGRPRLKSPFELGGPRRSPSRPRLLP